MGYDFVDEIEKSERVPKSVEESADEFSQELNTPLEAKEYRKLEPFIEKTCVEFKGFEGKCSVIAGLALKAKDAQEAVLEDWTGQVTVVFADLQEFDSLREGKVYRVLGRARRKSTQDPSIVVEAERVQDFEGFDLQLFKRVKTLELMERQKP